VSGIAWPSSISVLLSHEDVSYWGLASMAIEPPQLYSLAISQIRNGT
jgi:hypothetical protein